MWYSRMVSTLNLWKAPGLAHWLGRVPPTLLTYKFLTNGSEPIWMMVSEGKERLLPQETGSVPVRGMSVRNS